MSFLKQFLKDVKKDDYTSLLSAGENSAEIKDYIDTGCYIFNALLSASIYKGMPSNKVIAIAGESTTGKTYLALGIIKHHLDRHPEALVVHYDTESAITKDMMISRGIDANRVIIVEPETIQQFRTHVLNVILTYEANKDKDKPPIMVVLDSLGQLSTTKEMQDSIDGKETVDMTKAKVIKATFRTVRMKAAKANVPLLLTNHTYATMDMYPTQELSGGTGLKYSADIIVMLAKSKDKVDTQVVGNFIRAKNFKNRLAVENAQVKMRLNYRTGLDKYYGLVDIAEKYGIFKKVSTRFEMPDGTKVFEKQIYADPERWFTKEVLDQIDIAAQKEFSYGTGEGSEHGDEDDFEGGGDE